MLTRQELHCHNCSKYVQFEIDDELDGEHKLNCPDCNHEHYRVVEKGVITDKRWGSANRNSWNVPTGYTAINGSQGTMAYTATVVSSSTVSTWDTYSSGTRTSTDQGTVATYTSWTNSYYRGA